jgi:hypothetical protein
LHFVAFNEQLQIGSEPIEIKLFSVAKTFHSQTGEKENMDFSQVQF